MSDTTIPTRYRADTIVVRPGLDGEVWLRTLVDDDDLGDGRMVCLRPSDVAALVAALQGRTAPAPLTREEQAAARADHEHDRRIDDALTGDDR